MRHSYGSVVQSWGTKVRFSLPAYLWFLVMIIHTNVLFPLKVVLPFTLLAVGSAALFSRLSPKWPKYPLPLGKNPPAPWSSVD